MRLQPSQTTIVKRLTAAVNAVASHIFAHGMKPGAAERVAQLVACSHQLLRSPESAVKAHLHLLRACAAAQPFGAVGLRGEGSHGEKAGPLFVALAEQLGSTDERISKAASDAACMFVDSIVKTVQRDGPSPRAPPPASFRSLVRSMRTLSLHGSAWLRRKVPTGSMCAGRLS